MKVSPTDNTSNPLMPHHMDRTADPVLSDRIRVNFNNNKHGFASCYVKLTQRYLCVDFSRDNNDIVSTESDIISFAICDVVGCHLIDSEQLESVLPHNKSSEKGSNSTTAYFSVIAYPFKCPSRLSFSRNSKRERKVLTFAIDKFETRSMNQEHAARWVRTLIWLRDERVPDATLISKPSKLPDVPNAKRLLVMVNPASGPGKAGIIFKDCVAPLLMEAGISVTLFVSSKSGAAREYVVKTSDLTRHFDGIVIVSGDGLIFEVFNGLMSRDDWDQAIKIPIGVVPGGSGNGLSFSINYAVGETSQNNQILASTLNIIHGRRTPLDLIQVESASKTYYSFLSIGWGLLADMDIQSEGLRFMGGFRFVVYGIIRSLALKKYRGRLSFLPANCADVQNNRTRDDDSQKNNSEISVTDPLPEDWTVVEGEFVMVYTAHTSHMSPGCFLAPDARLDDGIIWLLYITGDVTKSQVVSFLMSVESGKHVDLPFVNLVPVRGFRLEPFANCGLLTIDGELIDTEPIQAHVLPSIANVMSK